MEAFGTFLITYASCWATIQKDLGIIKNMTVGLCTLTSITLLYWLCFKKSGAHFNPAISIGLIVIKKMEWTVAIFYILVQLLGALLAAFLIYIQLSNELLAKIADKSGLGIPKQEINEISGFWGEMIGMFIINWVYLSICVDPLNKKSLTVVGVCMGCVYAVMILTVGIISGGCFNPARSFGPSILMGRFDKEQFIHFFGPLSGAIFSSFIYSGFFLDDEDDFQDDQDEIEIQDLNNNESKRMIEKED
jgi:MIP family channel proteins